jgi:hypothetical protein
MILRIATVDDTAGVEMFLNGSDARATIPTDTAWMFDIQIIATAQGMATVQKFHRSGCIVNDGGNTSISSLDTIGTDQAIGSPSGWAIAITADDTNDALKIAVTWQAETNIRCVAKLRLVEVSYPEA